MQKISLPHQKSSLLGDIDSRSLGGILTFFPDLFQVINSLSCAQRGWINVDVDKIECESCGAYLSFALIPSWTPSEG